MVSFIRIILLFVSILIFNASIAQINRWDVLNDTCLDELFHSYLMKIIYQEAENRTKEVDASLISKYTLFNRQQKIYSNYLFLVGKLPERQALNAEITGTIDQKEYKIEKVVFESLPHHHVTANFYIPISDSVKYPTVLVTCGHYPEGKSHPVLQKLCILLAQHGIAAFIVDPVCQSERYQIIDETTGELKFVGGSGTTAHTLLDVGAVLTGTSMMAYELTDNIAALDYLYSRSDMVDTARIGCTGGSGGGAQATFLSAYDKRIKVAVVTSFLMNKTTLFSTIGPQTASQNLIYEGAFGLDHPDYITMFAPKPFMIIAATNDFFNINGTRETYTEAVNVYKTLGFPSHLSYYETNDGHDWTTPKREKAVQWFNTWFYNDTSAIFETITDELLSNQLIVTPTGQVSTSYKNEMNLTDLIMQQAKIDEINRFKFWSVQTKDAILSKIKELIKLENYQSPTYTIAGQMNEETCTVDKLIFLSGDDVPVTGLLYTPKSDLSKFPVIIYADGRGKNVAANNGLIENQYVQNGYMVLNIDLRGFGETTDNATANPKKYYNNEQRNGTISLYLGKTLIGQRVSDIQKTIDILVQFTKADTCNITLVGVDRAAIPALHAAAIDQRITQTLIQSADTSFLEIIHHPLYRNKITAMVPNALQYYDLPDLLQLISPRSVQFINPND